MIAPHFDIELEADEYEELQAWKLEDEAEMQAQALELLAEPFAHVPDRYPLPF